MINNGSSGIQFICMLSAHILERSSFVFARKLM